MNLANKVGFAIGTGRCGTLFLHQVTATEPEVASSHERNPDNEAFHRYCKWNRLPVDDAGFLATKEAEILGDLEQRAFSFEASPYLALSARELHERFGAKFVFLVRRPDGVVTSFVHKGFYRQPYSVKDVDRAAGYQNPGSGKFFTYLARIAPRGEFFATWNGMTQVGKVAWFWNALNRATLDLIESLPADCCRTVRIEDLEYPKYREICEFLGFRSGIPEGEFEALRTARPHAFWNKRTLDTWTAQEIREFESQVAEMAERFGYRYRIADLVDEARAERAASVREGRIPAPKPTPRFWRARRATAEWLRAAAKSLDVT